LSNTFGIEFLPKSELGALIGAAQRSDLKQITSLLNQAAVTAEMSSKMNRSKRKRKDGDSTSAEEEDLNHPPFKQSKISIDGMDVHDPHGYPLNLPIASYVSMLEEKDRLLETLTRENIENKRAIELLSQNGVTLQAQIDSLKLQLLSVQAEARPPRPEKAFFYRLP